MYFASFASSASSDVVDDGTLHYLDVPAPPDVPALPDVPGPPSTKPRKPKKWKKSELIPPAMLSGQVFNKRLDHLLQSGTFNKDSRRRCRAAYEALPLVLGKSGK